MAKEKNIDQFNRDVSEKEGYLYTGKGLSSVMANSRITSSVLSLARVKGKSVIDIGCGDGTYTFEIADGGAAGVLGVDAAEEAVARAASLGRNVGNVDFEVADVYELQSLGRHFDVGVIRGVLHHLYDAPRAIRSISSIADRIVVVEPNGYSPILKIIEKISPYHRAHEEKSYRPSLLRKWFEDAGGTVLRSEYIGLVPMFCPDLAARILKFLEPAVENTPLLTQMICAQYVMEIGTSPPDPS